jgi:hypothetical protein
MTWITSIGGACRNGTTVTAPGDPVEEIEFRCFRALKRRLGEGASPEGLVASFRTRDLAEPAPSLRSGQAL